jgi:hypothetical protein
VRHAFRTLRGAQKVSGSSHGKLPAKNPKFTAFEALPPRAAPPVPTGCLAMETKKPTARTKKTCKCRAFSRAAEGIRTLDLLHGQAEREIPGVPGSPGKEQFPSYRWSAILPSFHREIAGVSGLKPDWGSE